MRLSAREFGFAIRTSPDSIRPVRLRVGGLTYCLDAAEALGLATQLADVVAELKTPKPKALDFFDTTERTER